jgi:hypothetical protein
MKHPLNTKVKVKDNSQDEMFNDEYIGLTGILIEHNENGMTGNTPDDPLHIVLFEDGTKESFWFQELEVVKFINVTMYANHI